MPLPNDETLIALSESLIAQLNTLFGTHPGFRPAHAKGALLQGTFRPTAAAADLSTAPHFHRESTPVTVRFSNSTGLPKLADNDPNADPRGLAIRFHLAERVHTDIISHSTDGFPTRTGEEFLEFLRAVAASPPGSPSPSALEQFLGQHPAALRFVQTPKPTPRSFASEAYFGVNAMRFLNREQQFRYGRYRILPVLPVEHLTSAAGQNADYLFEEIKTRVAAAPVLFRLHVQLAEPEDKVDDATSPWPDTRTVLELGTLELDAAVDPDEEVQRHLIFDPIPRVEGIEPSDDPLLELRAAIYLISGRRRRAAAPATV